eukprot:TRINITY_DN72993_c0_g1_i2.p1 TRINITY_DN72993_c0_g1~~TRINITY_DN72993_c0_g1_i2.p1  ORF type:complete len:209 (-),score=4.59 TRINITY_DN72993_c0_g1_i2:77-703(-)
MMLEKQPRRSLEITRSLISEVYESHDGSARMNVDGAREHFARHIQISATYPLTCRRIYPEPGKRIQVTWSELEPGTKNQRSQKRGYVPVDAVQPVYSRAEARNEYGEMMRAYERTGTTKAAWIEYFFQPLFLPLFTAILGTLAVRLVLHFACWPVVSGLGEGFMAAYFHALETFQERTLVTYVTNTVQHAASLGDTSRSVVQALNLLL